MEVFITLQISIFRLIGSTLLRIFALNLDVAVWWGARYSIGNLCRSSMSWPIRNIPTLSRRKRRVTAPFLLFL